MNSTHPTLWYNILNMTLVCCLAGLMFTLGCSRVRYNGEASVTVVKDTTFASPADSLKYLIEQAKSDTLLVDLYLELGFLYTDPASDTAKIYLQKASVLSEELNYAAGYCQFACYYATIMDREGKMDTLFTLFQNGLKMARETNNDAWSSRMLANLGNTYLRINFYQTALEYYLQALPHLEKTNYRLYQLYDNMQVLYNYLGNYDQSIEYGEKALDIIQDASLNIHDDYSLAAILVNLSIGYLHVSPPQFEKALHSLQQALRIAEANNYLFTKSIVFTNLADYHKKRNEMQEAETFFRQALELKTMITDKEGMAISMIGLAICELYKKNYKNAEAWTNQALDIANEFALLDIQRSCMLLLGRLALVNQDYNTYALYDFKSDSVSTLIRNQGITLAIQEMQTKYETEKKVFKIAALEDEKRLIQLLSLTGGVILLLALAAAIIFWRLTVHKKKVAEQQKQLAEQQVIQLEQEKQLIATQSVLDGETQERTRLARDLHDGLGSLLTGVKLRLLEMKKGALLAFIDVAHFDNALGLLDDSIREMRRVAHNLMPDSLSRFGLKPAVSDFCSNLPIVRFTYYGDESRLDPKLEVMIYRSIHELVNNALKHAGAKEILVQIIQEYNRIAFTVQDDGCGFDLLTGSQGMGLQNIRTRVTSYNGVFNIDSSVGEGTEVNVELSIEND